MYKFTLIAFLLLCWVFTKAQNKEMEISYSVTYEGKVKGLNYYSISWKDTLGTGNGHYKFDRPIELHCVIKNLNDSIIGKYTGMSSQFTFASFGTNHKKVKLYFSKACNKFYSKINKEVWNYKVEFIPFEIDLKIPPNNEVLKNQITILIPEI